MAGTGSMEGLRLLARLEREAVTRAASFTGLPWFRGANAGFAVEIRCDVRHLLGRR